MRRKATAAAEAAMPAAVKKLRCAVYTRKSTEEGLEKEFNSLDAQRDACEAFIASQRAEGWVLVPDHYDDGGVSGGTLERPALQRLLRDIEAGRVDVVVVYKIDRLSRSLMHFAKLVEVFDANSVTFVSVTQSFNTTTSMGRLTLNILLSFAQFEREVIGERVRDKIAASKARGMWMGGLVPLGYDVRDRKLMVNEEEAARVWRIFEGFAAIGSATRLVPVLRNEGVLTKTGRPFDKGALYKLLNNRTYLGEVTHKEKVYPGEHRAIVPRELWDRVHAILQESPRVRANQNRRRGGRKLVETPDGTGLGAAPARTRADPALIKALARAHRWKRLLETGRYASLGELAAAEKIDRSYLGKTLRLTLLAPDIVEPMLDGRQPADLGTALLMEPLSAEWSEQRQALLNARPVPCRLHVQPSLDR